MNFLACVAVLWCVLMITCATAIVLTYAEGNYVMAIVFLGFMFVCAFLIPLVFSKIRSTIYTETDLVD